MDSGTNLEYYLCSKPQGLNCILSAIKLYLSVIKLSLKCYQISSHVLLNCIVVVIELYYMCY